MTPAKLIDAARLLIGVPYVHQGHSVHGVDCIGFVFTAAQIAGIDMTAALESTSGEKLPAWNYSRSPQPQGLERAQRWLKQITQPVPGCVVFFKFPSAEHPSHFAIYTGTSIIHALSTQRKVVEQSFGEPWLRWAHSYWQVPSVIYV